jgi:hypothetical protein
MKRRNILRGAAGAGTALSIGSIGFLATSGGASATAGSSIADPAAGTTDDGEIRYINTKTTGRLTWDGFDKPAKYARIRVGVELHRNGNKLDEKWIHDTDIFSLSGDWGGSGEETSLDGDYEDGQAGYVASDSDWDIIQAADYSSDSSLPSDPMAAQRLFAEEDGSSKKTRVVLKSQYRLYDANENELTGTSGYPDRPQSSADFVVTVNNQESTTGFGDGDATGDTRDSATVGT